MAPRAITWGHRTSKSKREGFIEYFQDNFKTIGCARGREDALNVPDLVAYEFDQPEGLNSTIQTRSTVE